MPDADVDLEGRVALTLVERHGDIRPDLHGFEIEALINVRAAKLGLNVVEVPSFEKSRRHGASNLHARRDGIRVLRTILGERIRPSRPTP